MGEVVDFPIINDAHGTHKSTLLYHCNSNVDYNLNLSFCPQIHLVPPTETVFLLSHNNRIELKVTLAAASMTRFA